MPLITPAQLQEGYDVMEPVTSRISSERLDQVKAAPECVIYAKDVRIGHKHTYWVSIFGLYTTAEIFVQVTDRRTTRVRCFFSRHKSCPPELRRKELPLVDVSDAFALARWITQHWATKTHHPFS
jgi:hypothetical protein